MVRVKEESDFNKKEKLLPCWKWTSPLRQGQARIPTAKQLFRLKAFSRHISTSAASKELSAEQWELPHTFNYLTLAREQKGAAAGRIPMQSYILVNLGIALVTWWDNKAHVLCIDCLPSTDRVALPAATGCSVQMQLPNLSDPWFKIWSIYSKIYVIIIYIQELRNFR